MSRHTKPQTTSSGTRSVPASSALEGLRQNRPVPVGTPIPPPAQPPARMPWGPDDWHGACVLHAFDAIHKCRRSEGELRNIPADYTPTPEWSRVVGSPWRRITSFEGVAKRARGGGTSTTMQGPDWAKARALAENGKGLPLRERLQSLVDTGLDSDALIATIAEMLADA